EASPVEAWVPEPVEGIVSASTQEGVGLGRIGGQHPLAGLVAVQTRWDLVLGRNRDGLRHRLVRLVLGLRVIAVHRPLNLDVPSMDHVIDTDADGEQTGEADTERSREQPGPEAAWRFLDGDDVLRLAGGFER